MQDFEACRGVIFPLSGHIDENMTKAYKQNTQIAEIHARWTKKNLTDVDILLKS
jgi:hypothetical protein